MLFILSFLFNFFIFVFGMCIGSFLNCVIYRLPDKSLQSKHFDGPATISPKASLGGEQWWLGGRSRCLYCKHALNWQDLFPVFSFLFLGGKCRYCIKKISTQYPVVEILTGVIFLSIFNFQFSIFNEFSIFQLLNLLFWFYVASALIIIFVYDLKHYLIPDKILFPAIIIAFIYRLFENLVIVSFIENWKLKIENFAPLSLLNYIIAVLLAAGFFLAIFLASKGRWMGFGDVKLAVLMGLLLGLPNVLLALFLAFFFGAIVGGALILTNKKKLKSEIPFGPFLISGTFIAMLWGSQIIEWYFKLFLI